MVFLLVDGFFSTAARLLMLSWAFSYSLTKLQNYSLCESLIKPDEATKSGKSTITTSKLLFAKIFSLKQKTNQILSATLEKIKYCLFKKTVYVSFKKQKPFRQMQIYLYIFWHIQIYFGISRYIHRHIQNPL